MLWLIGHVWLWMLASASAGVILTGVLSVKLVAVRRWVEEPVLLELPADDEPSASTTEPHVTPEPEVPEPVASPFPEMADGARPWEDEETWSRPRSTPAGRRRKPSDEWDEAAEHWREWADAAKATPDAPSAVPELTSPTFPTGPVAGGVSVFPDAAEGGLLARAAFDDFPHAAPVEAAPSRATVPEPDPAEYARRAAMRLESERQDAERFAALPPEEPSRALEPYQRPGVPERPRHAATVELWSPATRQNLPAEVELRVVPVGPYGEGSAYPSPEGSAPLGYPIKANLATKLFHPPGSRYFSRAEADAWFDTEAAAEAAGFMRWDRRATVAHEVLQAGRPDRADEKPSDVA